MIKDHIEIIYRTVSGITVGVIALLKWWFARNKKKDIEFEASKEGMSKIKRETAVEPPSFNYPHIIRSSIAIKRIHNILNYIVSNTDATRAIILKNHNGGKIPTLTEKMYVTIMYESTGKGVDQASPKFQKQEIDQDYHRLLVELMQNRKIMKKTSELEDPSMLRDHYISDGVTFSKIFEIYFNKEVYVYLSVNFNKNPDDFNSIERDILRASATELKNLFSEELNNIR